MGMGLLIFHAFVLIVLGVVLRHRLLHSVSRAPPLAWLAEMGDPVRGPADRAGGHRSARRDVA